MGDYPDYTTDVVRTPIQSIPQYQTFGCLNIEETATDLENDTYIWDIPDDDYYYAIDSVYMYWVDLFPIFCYVAQSAGRDPYDWSNVGAACREYSVEIVPSKMGSLSLIYPNSLRLSINNPHDHNLTWYAIVNYFTYVI